MFLFQNPSGKRLDGIPCQNRDHTLGDDGPTVERLVNKMNRTARELHAVFERLPLRVKTRK